MTDPCASFVRERRRATDQNGSGKCQLFVAPVLSIGYPALVLI
jgi:hypothetical protein